MGRSSQSLRDRADHHPVRRCTWPFLSRCSSFYHALLYCSFLQTESLWRSCTVRWQLAVLSNTFLKKEVCTHLLLAALSVHCCAQASSSCSKRGPLSSWGDGLLIAAASPLVAHGLWGPRASGLQFSGLVASRHVGSFWTRDQTSVLDIGRQILNHWATRDSLKYFLIKIGIVFLDIRCCRLNRL